MIPGFTGIVSHIFIADFLKEFPKYIFAVDCLPHRNFITSQSGVGEAGWQDMVG